MKTIPSLLCALLALLLLTGCVGFDYDGESYPEAPVGQIVVYEPGTGPENQRIFGHAVVTGNYQNTSREQMIERLKEEAAARGAASVVLLTDRVLLDGSSVPSAECIGGTTLNNSAISENARRDFGQNYGTASYDLLGNKVNPGASAAPARQGYRRIMTAAFYRPAAPEQPPAK